MAASDADAVLALDNQLCFALYSASRAVTRLYRPILSALGLTYPQYLVMLVLWESRGAPSLGEIGDRLALDSGTLTPLLKRMEQAGLLCRRRDSLDERELRVQLTPAGRRLKRRASEVPAQVSVHSSLSVDDFVELRQRLRRLLSSIET